MDDVAVAEVSVDGAGSCSSFHECRWGDDVAYIYRCWDGGGLGPPVSSFIRARTVAPVPPANLQSASRPSVWCEL